jgi:hypothetical protein
LFIHCEQFQLNARFCRQQDMGRIERRYTLPGRCCLRIGWMLTLHTYMLCRTSFASPGTVHDLVIAQKSGGACMPDYFQGIPLGTYPSVTDAVIHAEGLGFHDVAICDFCVGASETGTKP